MLLLVFMLVTIGCSTVVTRVYDRRAPVLFIVAALVAAALAAATSETLAFSIVGAAEVTVTAIALARSAAMYRAWYAAHAGGITLQPPFSGTWSVAVSGPMPRANHHLVASDQRYACDLVAAGGSRGRPILAPCHGEIVHAVDAFDDAPDSRYVTSPPRGAELGNHVVVRPDGTGTHVFLCHLQRGSVAVKPGDRVAPGDLLGRCGNSGRTSRSHLHIHAQDLDHYAFNRATGIPISFIDRSGTPRPPVPWRRVTGP